MRPGELVEALVDGEPMVVYLSLTTEEKGLERRDHCWRMAPPSNQIVRGRVTDIKRINQTDTWRRQRM